MNYKISILFLFVVSLGLDPAQQEVQEAEYFKEYAQHMENFIPAQTFSVKLAIHEYQEYMLPAPAEAKTLRGMFYIDSMTDHLLLFSITRRSGHVQFTASNKRIAVFRFPLSEDPIYYIRVKNAGDQKQVHLTYEFVGDAYSKPVSTSQFKPVIDEFSKIHSAIEQSQVALRILIQHNIAHVKSLIQQTQIAVGRAVIQTLILAGSAIATLVLLRRTIRKGYVAII